MRSWEPDQPFEQTRNRRAPDRTGGRQLNRVHDGVSASLLSLTVRRQCPLANGKLQVELPGLDVHEPTSGEIRSLEPGQADCDIACDLIAFKKAHAARLQAALQG